MNGWGRAGDGGEGVAMVSKEGFRKGAEVEVEGYGSRVRVRARARASPEGHSAWNREPAVDGMGTNTVAQMVASTKKASGWRWLRSGVSCDGCFVVLCCRRVQA